MRSLGAPRHRRLARAGLTKSKLSRKGFSAEGVLAVSKHGVEHAVGGPVESRNIEVVAAADRAKWRSSPCRPVTALKFLDLPVA